MTKDSSKFRPASSSVVLAAQAPVQSPNSDYAALRGITNIVGSNNCFLNCAVQGLWNLDPFRASFVLINEHVCADKSCIFCSLLKLAEDYQYHEHGPVTPDILRNALASAYQVDNRFQIGFMEDAAECFEGILCNLHNSLSDSSSDSLCTAGSCIAHRLFSMTLVDQDKCKCGASSEPLTFDQYIFYAAVSSLTDAHASDPTLTFGALLKHATCSTKPCPDEYGKETCCGPALLGVSMIEKPDVFCVGMSWPYSDNTVFKKLADCIEVELDLDELFENVSASSNNVYKLVGIMAYYGKHYFTFFFHSAVEKWLLYDDASVSEVGKSWDSVRRMLIKGKYQPLVLLYVNPVPEKSVLTSKNVLSQAYISLKSIKEKQKLKSRLAKLSSREPKSNTNKVAVVASAPPISMLDHPSNLKAPSKPNVPSSLAMKPELHSHISSGTIAETTPELISQSRKFLDNMATGVEETVSAGLSLLGLQDGEGMHKKRFVNDCVKQADTMYFDAKKALNLKEYSKALDFAIDASHMYKYILTHEDSSFNQRETAQIRCNTAKIRAKRISRRIPTSQLTDTQLNSLFHKCPLCDRLKEDEMQLCYECTRYCKSCCSNLEITESEYCAKCFLKFEDSVEFEGNRSKGGKSAKLVTDSSIGNFTDLTASSPPPYESLKKTRCRICHKYVVTRSDICHSCSSMKESPL